MRTPQEFKDLVEMVLVEEMNRMNFETLRVEPENVVPKFIEEVSNRLAEICMDEIAFRRS